jgi:hypothetical protein
MEETFANLEQAFKGNKGRSAMKTVCVLEDIESLVCKKGCITASAYVRRVQPLIVCRSEAANMRAYCTISLTGWANCPHSNMIVASLNFDKKSDGYQRLTINHMVEKEP